jgi:hypothetical protein
MNFTLQAMEHIRARKDAEWYANLPAEEKAERSHYWFIERKSRNGRGKWTYVRDYMGTKKEAAELFCKHFRNRADGRKYRLHHLLEY